MESSEDDLSELANIRSESVQEIEKDMFQGLAKWAQIKKKEELSKQNRGIIKRLLSVQKKNAPASHIEQYSIQKFDLLVRQATVAAFEGRNSISTNPATSGNEGTPDRQSRSSLQKMSQAVKSEFSANNEDLQNAQLHQKSQEIMEENLMNFTEKFPQLNTNLKRRHSYCAESNEQKTSIVEGKTKECHSSKDLKIKDVIEFFRYLKQTNIGKYSKINEIYKYLHYDVIESTVFQEDPDKQLKEVQFPRTFGPWGQIWSDKQQVIRESSPFRILKSYQLRPFIVKGGDDLRQELLAMNIIQKFHEIFTSTGTPLYLRPYEIIVESDNSGFIEFLPNTLSLDALKKNPGGFKNLNDFFQRTFGEYFLEAQKNFIESLAGYSLISYLLQIKDRHNGNILIDNRGHIIHIDFGFILTTAPGGIKFETAHFKLTTEYVDLMGGRNSDQFGYFKSLLVRGFIEIKKHVSTICNLVQIMYDQSSLACFQDFDMIQFRGRFRESYTDKEFLDYVEDLVKGSYDKWSTNQYDKYQQMTNGILP